MRGVGAGSAGGQAGSAGVGKEVKNLGVGAGDGHLVKNPFPVGRLFGKDSEVLKGRALQVKMQLGSAQVVGQGPLSDGSGLERPVARLGVLLGPAEVGVGTL